MISQLQSYLQQDEIRFPEGFDLAALLLYSLTGALLAMRRGYDLIGVFILALVVGAGGGLIRDGLFLQQGPPMLTRNWRLLPAVLGACLIGWFVHHWVFRMHKVVAVLDAVGLSVLSMVGLVKSIEAGLSAPAAVLVGVVNASGGGLLRDILTQEEPLIFKPGQFYVVASLVGCGVFLLLAYKAVVTPRNAVIIAMVTTFALRVLAIIFNWRTAPLQPCFGSPSSSDAPDPANRTEKETG